MKARHESLNDVGIGGGDEHYSKMMQSSKENFVDANWIVQLFLVFIFQERLGTTDDCQTDQHGIGNLTRRNINEIFVTSSSPLETLISTATIFESLRRSDRFVFHIET